MVANALACYDREFITAVKSFVVQAQGPEWNMGIEKGD